MKNLGQILLTLILLLTFQTVSYPAEIDRTISKSGINKGAVSVSVKDIQTGTCVYSLNETQPVMPASTLKIITASAAVDTLGKDYKFATKLYKNTKSPLQSENEDVIVFL